MLSVKFNSKIRILASFRAFFRFFFFWGGGGRGWGVGGGREGGRVRDKSEGAV